MSDKKKMVDTATGSSPPWTCTRNVASSCVHMRSSIELKSREDFDHLSILLYQEKENIKENVVLRK